MQMRRAVVVVVVVVVTLVAVGAALAGCGDESSVSLVGESTEHQADEIASAVCEREQACGKHRVYCTTSGNGQLDCTGFIDRPRFDACYDAARANALEDLGACGLTAAQEATLEACINYTLAQSCVTQAEVDAQALQIEAGGLPDPLRPPSPECIEIEHIFALCAP